MQTDRSVHWLKAVHEAGHAVIATARGQQVNLVTIRLDEAGLNVEGGCLIEEGAVDAVTCLAGPLAWARAARENPDLVDDEADEDESSDDEDVDWEMVAVFGSGLSDYPKAEELVGQEGISTAEDEARRLVGEHWAAIERVATVLDKFKAIDGGQVREAIEAEAICLFCSYPVDRGHSTNMHDACREAVQEFNRGREQ